MTYKEVPLQFNQGLNLQFESSLIPDGSSAVLENWVPETTNGVRVRQGWSSSSKTGGPATATGLGLSSFNVTPTNTHRQRGTAKGSMTGVLFDFSQYHYTATIGWPQATLTGSTLIMNVLISRGTGNDVQLAPDHFFVEAGWEILKAVQPTNSNSLMMVACNVGAPGQSSTSLSFQTGVSGTVYWAVEMFELQNLAVGSASKNLLDSFGSTFEPYDNYASGANLTSATYHDVFTHWQWDPVNYAFSGGIGQSTDNCGVGGSYASMGLGSLSTTGLGSSNYAYTTGTAGIPITANTPYTWSVYSEVNLNFAQATNRLDIRWYDNTGALISTTTGSTNTYSNNNTWQRDSVTGTSPGNAAYASPLFFADNNSSPALNHFIDCPQFEAGSSATDWVVGGGKTQTIIDQYATNTDSVSPISLASGLSTVKFTYADAICFNDRNNSSVAYPTFSGWTNNFTSSTDLTTNTGSQFYSAHLASAYKILTTIGSSVNTDVTESVDENTRWLIINYKFGIADLNPVHLYIAAQNNSTSFDLYKINNSDITSGSWSLIENEAVVTSDIPVSFSAGLGTLLFTHPAMATPKTWNNSSPPISIPQMLNPGKTSAFFKSRFFVAGDIRFGTRLFYSDIGDAGSWPALNFLDIGSADGYAIEDLASTQAYLVVGKGNGIYTLSGSGPDTFFLSQLPYGNASPGRSIAVTPIGAIVAGTATVWSIVSGTVEDIGQQLGASYDPQGYVFSTYVDGKVYILDASAKVIWVYDLDTKTWYKEIFTSNNNQLLFLMGDSGKRLLGQPTASTDTGLLFYKDLPPVSRFRDFSPIVAQTKLSSPVMWLAGPGQTITPRWLFLQIRQRGNGAEQLKLTTHYDDSSGNIELLDVNSSAGVYRRRIDLGAKRGVSSLQFDLEGPTSGNQFDIESAMIGYDVEEIA